MKIVYDESYGELSYAQRAAYRKYNVSPSDHNGLELRFGNDHKAITEYVKFNASNNRGMFSFLDLARDVEFGIAP